ncbi:MAG: hypothetical protein GY821_15705 [Gammaproteobacteria bacterium]|nr:hypothetical protein [Gammaproteobacteria bacterium]
MNRRVTIWFARGCTVVTFFVIFLLFICHWWQTEGSQIPYNSDLLMYPQVAMNLIHQQGNYFDWNFTSVIFLFPDLLLCLLIALFTKNFALIVLVYAFIQIGYFILIGRALINRAVTNDQMRAAAVVIMLFSLWLLAHPQNIVILLDLPHPSVHISCTLMILTLLWLLLILFDRPEKKFIVLFSVILILAMASDPLLLSNFVMPVLASLTLGAVFKQIRWRSYVKLVLWLTVLSVLAWALYRAGPFAIPRYLHARLHYFHLITLYQLAHVLASWIRDSPFVGNMWLAAVIFMPISLLTKRGSRPIDFVLLTLFLQIVIGLTFFCFFRPDRVMPIRYLQSLLVVPAFIAPLLLLAKHWPNCRPLQSCRAYIAALLFLLLSALAVPRPALQLHNRLHYYPENIACIDRHVKAFGLKTGIGGYWDFRPVMLFSRTGLVVASVDSNNLVPFSWNNSRADYRNRTFNFVLLNKSGVSAAAMEKVLGTADNHFTCGNYTVAVYQYGQLNRFMATQKPLGVDHFSWSFQLFDKWFG